MKYKVIAYLIAAAAGIGLIYVPHEMFYDPDVFFANYY